MASAQPLSIDVYGNIGDEHSDLVGVLIQVSQNGRVILTTKTDPNGEYGFQVPVGGEYLAVVSREGFVTKRFTISTLGVPKDNPEFKFKPIGASINLFRKMEGVDYSALDQAMMKFRYNPDIESMEYDKDYQAIMNEKIRKIEEAEKEIKKREKDNEARFLSLVKDGDKAFGKKEYANSITNYSEALKIKPKEAYPQAQIENIKRIMSETDALAKRDAEAKSKADAEILAKKQADDAAAKAKADSEAAARNQADKERADKLASEKAAADAKLKSEADLRAKEAADALAKKQKEEAELKSKSEKDLAAKNEAEKARTEKLAKEKELADAKAKADAAAIEKKQTEELAAKAKAEKEKADLLAQQRTADDLKAKADKEAADKLLAQTTASEKAQALAKEKADKELADKVAKEAAEKDRLTKEKEAAVAKVNAEKLESERLAREKLAAEAKAKTDKEEADKKKSQEALLAKIKADKELEEKKNTEKAAADAKLLAETQKKVKDAEDAKKKLEEAERLKNEKIIADAAEKNKVTASVDNKTNKSISSVLGDDTKYKDAIRKGDNFYALQRYAEAKKAYEEALLQKGGDPYAKAQLLECEKKLQADGNQITDEKQKQLLAKYPEGVTEEIISLEGVVIIKRVLVKDRHAFVYEKKIFNWGGLAYFRDGAPITEPVFEQETRK